MPLTFVHPVAVLLFRRIGLPLSALIVGSVTPDLEYLIYLAPHGELGHTIIGLFVFCLPMGLITLLLLHGVWEHLFYGLLRADVDASQKDRSNSFPFWPLSRFVILIVALVVGALTHLVWDSFTHQSGWAVQHMPILTATVLHSMWGGVKLFKILQHGSTIMGLIIMVSMAVGHYRKIRDSITPIGWRFLFLTAFTSIALGVGIALFKVGLISDIQAAKRLVGISIIASSAVFLLVVTLGGVLGRSRKYFGPENGD